MFERSNAPDRTGSVHPFAGWRRLTPGDVQPRSTTKRNALRRDQLRSLADVQGCSASWPEGDRTPCARNGQLPG
jgi:hypothetical protein